MSLRSQVRLVSMLVGLVVVSGCVDAREGRGAGEPIGVLATEMSARKAVTFVSEAPLGNVVTDAMLDAARRVDPTVQLAFLNAQSMGFDEVRVPSGIYPAGPISRLEVSELDQFDNELVVLDVSGERLLKSFERGVSMFPIPSPRFLHVSRGAELVVDPSRDAQGLSFTDSAITHEGARIVSARIDGKPLDPARTYRVCTTRFLAEGGEGLVALRGLEYEPIESLSEAIITYFQSKSPVDARVEGRIVVRQEGLGE